MDIAYVKEAIENTLGGIESITLIPEGISHDNYDVRLLSGRDVIARFQKNKRTDPFYGGNLSLEREAYLCNFIKDQTGIPAPRVSGPHSHKDLCFIISEKLPGISLKNFLEKQNYSLKSYLYSLEKLGESFAQAHKTKFNEFGDLMEGGSISPPGIFDFSQRAKYLLELKLTDANNLGTLSPIEIESIEDYFIRNNELASNSLGQPRLVLTDIHLSNFNVDEKTGEPSGFFDLEYCQAGIPSMDFTCPRTTIFPYFNEETMHKANDSFIKGYLSNGGEYDPDNRNIKNIEKTLYALQLLSATNLYFGRKDGVRDTWSNQFKSILFELVEGKDMNYFDMRAVFASKTGLPPEPRLS